jgi:hypothetical protein
VSGRQRDVVELRAKLLRPELRQLAQRVSVDFHLKPLDRQETRAYIRHRLTVAGGDLALFLPEAVEFVHARTNGVPRLLNQLGDYALVYAYADGRTSVDADLIDQVVRDRSSRQSLSTLETVDPAASGWNHERRRSRSTMLRHVLLVGLALLAWRAGAEDLSADRLGVIYNRNDRSSMAIAKYYAAQRRIPSVNLIGLSLPDRAALSRDELKQLRTAMLLELPSTVQSLLLVWARPYAAECMSVTTAFAAGYQPGFCEPGCQRTTPSALFDTQGWPARRYDGMAAGDAVAEC